MNTVFNLTSNPKLIIFDLDGTLVRPFGSELLPGVAEWFTYWRNLPAWNRPLLALATNQGGVGYRLHREELGGDVDVAKYPTKEQADARVFGVVDRLGLDPMLVYISYAYRFSHGYWADTPIEFVRHPQWSPNWRKPNPGMLQQALADMGVLPAQALMVGDMDSDKDAANAAGVPFQTATQFFRYTVPVVA